MRGVGCIRVFLTFTFSINDKLLKVRKMAACHALLRTVNFKFASDNYNPIGYMIRSFLFQRKDFDGYILKQFCQSGLQIVTS